MSEYSGPERRSLDQQAFYTAISKIEMVPNQINTLKEVMQIELKSIRNDLKNIEDKVMARVSTVESRLTEHCKDEDEIDRVLDEHDKSFEKAKSYIKEIEELKARVDNMEKEVHVLKNASKEFIYDVVKNIGKKLGAIILSVLGLALLFAIFNPTFWSEVFQKLSGG